MKVVIADVFIKQKNIIIFACMSTRCRATRKMVKSMIGIYIANIFKSQEVIVSTENKFNFLAAWLFSDRERVSVLWFADGWRDKAPVD